MSVITVFSFHFIDDYFNDLVRLFSVEIVLVHSWRMKHANRNDRVNIDFSKKQNNRTVFRKLDNNKKEINYNG